MFPTAHVIWADEMHGLPSEMVEWADSAERVVPLFHHPIILTNRLLRLVE